MTNYAGPGPDREPLPSPAEAPLSTTSVPPEPYVAPEQSATEGSTYTSDHARDTSSPTGTPP